MKIRYDFVSNSSSSSFVVWGIKLDLDYIFKAMIAHKFNFSDYVEDLEEFKKALKQGNFDYALDQVDMSDLFYAAFNKRSHGILLSSTYNYDTTELFVGSCPDQMHNDETLEEFKKRICDGINKQIGKNCNEIVPEMIGFFKGIVTDESFELE